MNALLKKSVLMFAALALVFGLNAASHSSNESLLMAKVKKIVPDAPKPHLPGHALMEGSDSGEMMLAAGGKLGLNGKAKGVPRAPVTNPKVKPPKGNKPPKVVTNDFSDEMMLAKGTPKTALPIDAPIKKAPHPVGTIHG